MSAITSAMAVEQVNAHEDHRGNKVANIAAPVDAGDAATKAYVDAGALFTPAVSGDWLAPPTTIAGALNELAARVKALEDA